MKQKPGKWFFALLALALCLLSSSMLVTEVAAADIVYYDNVEDAAEIVREAMVNRTKEVSFYYIIPMESYDSSLLFELSNKILDAAMEHTGEPNEGDYLKWQGSASQTSFTNIMSDGNGNYTFQVTYTFNSYYTTAEQEAELTARLETVIKTLNLDSKCDYQKVMAIHDYICANVTYDYTNLSDDTYTLKYTAYAALINGTSVCQGYATLFYRMALMAGLDVRYVSGTAKNSAGDTEGHAWNIVKIGGTYYYIDVTWDDGTSSNNYLLKGSTTFSVDHYLDADYTTEEFTNVYPVSTTDYDTSTEHSWGTPQFNWEEDHSACTATFNCSKGDGAATVICTITSSGTDATCTTNGSRTYTAKCTFNGIVYTDTTMSSTIESTGHSYEATVTNPTCTEKGYTTYTCSVCGDSYTAEETEATGHTAADPTTENVVAATCTTDGSYDSVVYCSVCGNELSRGKITVNANGHTSGEAVTENYTASTHTEDGSYDSVVYCSICGNELSRETITLSAGGHTSGEPVIENYKAPTCTEEGSYDSVVYCTECGEELSRVTITVDANGHTAGEAVVENSIAATCVDEGSYDSVVFCSVCGEELSRTSVTVEATGIHTYVLDEDASTAATCTTDGENVYVCSVCGDTYTETAEATDHTTEIRNARNATCTKEGYTGDEVCTVCGETVNSGVTISATGHTTEIQNAKDATCTEKGYTGDEVCTVCGETVEDGETIPATGHSYTTQVVAATYTEAGYTLYTCTHCGTSYKTDYTAIKVIDGTDGNLSTMTTVQELTAVPDGLKALYSSVDALISDLISRVTVNAGYTADNALVYDVVLQYSTDGGTTWITATVNNFPTTGITVTLPYPNGTDSSYEFTVLHMFTETSSRLNITAGGTETPTITKTEDGLVFTLTGLSPVAISWKEGTVTSETKADENTPETETEETDTSSQTDDSDTTTAEAADTTDTSVTSVSSTTVAPTGDNSNMLLWLILLSITGFGVFGVAAYSIKKKHGR